MVAAPVKVFAFQASITPHARGAAKDGLYAKGATDTKDAKAKDAKAVRDVSSRALVIASGSATDAAHDSAPGAEFGRLFREQAGTVPLPGAEMDASGVMPQDPGSLKVFASSSGTREELASGVVEPDGANHSQPMFSGGAPQSLLLSRLQSKLQGMVTGSAGAGVTEASASAPGPGKTTVGQREGGSLHPHRRLRDEGAGNNSSGTATALLTAPPSAVASVVIAPAPLVVPPSLQRGIAMPPGGAQLAADASPQTSKGGKEESLSAIPQETPAAPALYRIDGGAAKQFQLPVSLEASVTNALPLQIVAGGGGEQGAAGSLGGASEDLAVGRASRSSAEPEPTSLESHAFSPAVAVALPSGALAWAPSHPEQPSAAAPALPALSAAAAPAVMGLTSIYDRIDQAIAPVVLHSGVQHISVGVHDPNLGWVEIQTQNTAGHVDAMLVTASSQTHESLAAQLPAMAQFLDQREVRVGTLGVQQQMQNSGGVGSGAGNGGAMGSGTGYSGDRGAGGHRSGSGRNLPRSVGFQPSAGAASRAAPRTSSEVEGPLYRPLSYINVRA